jgi:GxxExxY protein
MFELHDPLAADYTKRPHNDLTGKIIGAAIEVHRTLGPGLLESTYEACLVFELQEKGLIVERQKPLPLVYKSVKLDSGYRLDLVVEGKVVVEIKSVSEVAAVHEAQLLSYLRLAGLQIGLLINFNVKMLKHGIHRIIS